MNKGLFVFHSSVRDDLRSALEIHTQKKKNEENEEDVDLGSLLCLSRATRSSPCNSLTLLKVGSYYDCLHTSAR